MNDYFKFPSTKHIMLPDDENARKDKLLTREEIEELLSHEITIEEKVDGANLGISFDDEGNMLLQNRGNWIEKPFTGQWSKLEHWLENRKDAIFDTLLNKYILFGEWCYARHSIYYDSLPDWFIGFDVYDKESGKFLSVPERNQILCQMRICIVHQYGKGRYTLKELKEFITKSNYGMTLCEGIYIRRDYNGWLQQRAKLVRQDFRQNMDRHWRTREWVANKLKMNSYR